MQLWRGRALVRLKLEVSITVCSRDPPHPRGRRHLTRTHQPPPLLMSPHLTPRSPTALRPHRALLRPVLLCLRAVVALSCPQRTMMRPRLTGPLSPRHLSDTRGELCVRLMMVSLEE